MNKKGLLLLLLLFTIADRAGRTLAQTPALDSSVTSDIRDAIRQEVQKRQSTPADQSTNLAIVGTILSLQATGNQVHIATTRQGDKVASTSAQTKIVRIGPDGSSRVVKLDNAAVGDNIIAMGQQNQDGTLTAKRVILYTQPTQKRLVYLGNVLAVTPTSISVKPAKSDQKTDFSLSSSTAIRPPSLKQGDLIIIAGTQSGDDFPKADMVIRLPSPTTPKPTAKPKATPSGT